MASAYSGGAVHLPIAKQREMDFAADVPNLCFATNCFCLAACLDTLMVFVRHPTSRAVLGSFAKFMDSRPFAEMANFLMVADAIHSER